MTYEEYLGWIEYYERFPFGWADDQRAGVIASTVVSAFAGKQMDPGEFFPVLKHMAEERKRRETTWDKLKTSKFFALMQNAQGGVKWEPK